MALLLEINPVRRLVCVAVGVSFGCLLAKAVLRAEFPRAACGGYYAQVPTAESAQPNNEPDLIIDVHSRSHVFSGFGVQSWDASAFTARVYTELNIRYARLSTVTAATMAIGRGVEVLYVRWSAPTEWMVGDNELATQYVDDYAALWADTVEDLSVSGVHPSFIELSNEPDGHWNTYISPANYNTLVKLTRAELDARGFSDVGIAGPGLSNLNWANHNAIWIGALDSQGVSSLAVWSSHFWDDGTVCSGGASCVSSSWPNFGVSADGRDPALPKLVTEFATSEYTFHGVTYPSPNDNRDYNATNSMPYAARVFENGLALINNGANAPFVWQARDQSWESKGWGLINLLGDPKPVYYALRTLWPEIAWDSWVVDLGDQSGSATYGGAFVADDRLVIGLANDSATTRQQAIRVLGVAGVQISSATACVIDHQGNPLTEDPDTTQLISRDITVYPNNSFAVVLPADSTLAIVCDLLFPDGDINLDGAVDLTDYEILSECMSGPGVGLPSGACTTSQFDRADMDGDGDVDLGDFCTFCDALE